MGIDIREGPNFACINCGLCIDACDGMMEKLSRPRGLIDYESWNNIELGRKGVAGTVRLLRPKTTALAGAILVLAMVMVGYLVTKSDLGISVVRDQNPVAVTLSDGSIRNAYSVRIYNNTQQERSYALRVHGLEDAEVRIVPGLETSGGGSIGVEASTNRVVRVLVRGFAGAVIPLEFIAVETQTDAEARASNLFMLPGR